MLRNTPNLLRADEMKRGQASGSRIVVTSFSVELGEVTFAITLSDKSTYTTLGACGARSWMEYPQTVLAGSQWFEARHTLVSLG